MLDRAMNHFRGVEIRVFAADFNRTSGRMGTWLGTLWLSGLGMLVGMAGCGEDAIYAGSQSIAEEGWRADEPVSFAWTVTDTTRKQDFFIDIRHDASYPFSNIYLFLDVSFPNGKRLRDTIACDLADAQGNWLGSGFGNLIDQRIGFRKGTSFPLPGDYRMDIAHAMRLDPLPGVVDVGFRLEKSREP